MLTAMNENLTMNDRFRYPDLVSGMQVQQVITLPKGSFIYRFAWSKRPLEEQVSSPWWFTEPEFLKLQRYFQLNPQNLGFIARTQGAVKYEWSGMDVLQKAVINHPIKGFTGPGEWVMEKTNAGSFISFHPPENLYQTYLPNLRDSQTRKLSVEAQQVIVALPATPIPSGDAIDQSINAMVGKHIVIPGNPRLH